MNAVTCSSCAKRNRVPLTASGTPACAACHTPLPWIVSADDTDYDQATSATVPVLVDLWAPWCGPCRVLGPIIEQVAGDWAGKLKVVKVDIETAPKLAQRLQVQGVPTLLLLSDSRPVARQTGALPADALRAWLDACRHAPDGSQRCADAVSAASIPVTDHGVGPRSQPTSSRSSLRCQAGVSRADADPADVARPERPSDPHNPFNRNC